MGRIVGCALAALCYLALAVLLVLLACVHREWVEVALLALEAEAHVEIMVVFIVLCLAFNWQAIRSQDVLQPCMLQNLGNRHPIFGPKLEHALNEIRGLVGDFYGERQFHALLSLVKSFHGLCFEWDCALQHNVK